MSAGRTVGQARSGVCCMKSRSLRTRVPQGGGGGGCCCSADDPPQCASSPISTWLAASLSSSHSALVTRFAKSGGDQDACAAIPHLVGKLASRIHRTQMHDPDAGPCQGKEADRVERRIRQIECDGITGLDSRTQQARRQPLDLVAQGPVADLLAAIFEHRAVAEVADRALEQLGDGAGLDWSVPAAAVAGRRLPTDASRSCPGPHAGEASVLIGKLPQQCRRTQALVAARGGEFNPAFAPTSESPTRSA